jgi:predicted RNase H-like nuclease
MLERREITVGATAASMVVVLAVAAVGTGCGPAHVDVDPATRYTAESLAQELIVRFQALNPAAKTSRRAVRVNPAAEKTRAERLERAVQAEKKGGGGPGEKKRKGAPTIDDVIDDVDHKLDLLSGTSRSDACRKMIAAISAESSLTAGEKKTLSDLVGRLAEGS